MTARRVEILECHPVLDKFFRVDEARLQYERFDGTMSPEVRRLSLERGDSVAALLFNRDTQRVILVNQFKYPTYVKGPGWLVEVVAGTVDPGEEPTQALRREVLEETGYQLNEVSYIGMFYLSPGGSSERIVLFYAEVVADSRIGAGGGLAQQGEDIELIEWSLSELWDAIERDQLHDAKTLVAAMWLRARIARKRLEG